MDTDGLIERVVKFLRNNGVLNGKPVYERVTEELACVDPRGHWEEYYHAYPYWQLMSRESQEPEFASIDSLLEGIIYKQVQENALATIPNDADSVMIEGGSGYGASGCGYLAAKLKQAKAVLISRPWEQKELPKYLFIPAIPAHPRLVFTKGQSVSHHPDTELRVNELYKENGVNNVIFYSHLITLDDVTRTKPAFLDHPGKRIYLFGHKAPRDLPFLLGLLYNKLEAKSLCVSMTAPEKVNRQNFIWEIIRRNLGLSIQELNGLVESAHDPNAPMLDEDAKTLNHPDKYDYKNPGQKRIGTMIKLGMALALAQEVNGKVFRNIDKHGFRSYNQADFYVVARR